MYQNKWIKDYPMTQRHITYNDNTIRFEIRDGCVYYNAADVAAITNACINPIDECVIDLEHIVNSIIEHSRNINSDVSFAMFILFVENAATTFKFPYGDQVHNACMCYRHDFGLMSDRDKDSMIESALGWYHAWRKAGLINNGTTNTRREDPPAKPEPPKLPDIAEISFVNKDGDKLRIDILGSGRADIRTSMNNDNADRTLKFMMQVLTHAPHYNCSGYIYKPEDIYD